MTAPRIVLLAMMVSLAGCKPPMAAPPPPPPAAVTVTRPVTVPVQNYYDYNGYLDAVEMVQVKARVQGFLNEIQFKDGDEVKKNDLLFVIDPREYQAAVKKAEADRLKAGSELKKAKSDETRAKQLVSNKAISEEEYMQRVSARETAEAVLKQTDAAVETAELQLGFTTIRSPIDGQISRTLVTRGNLVGQNETTLLTTIMRMDPLYVYFDVPERDLIDFQRFTRNNATPGGTPQEFPLDVSVANEEGFPHRGVIDFRENKVDTGTGTVRIRGRLPNPHITAGSTARSLYPGLYARVRVPAGGPQPKLVLPEDALMTGQEGRYVYVIGKDDTVQKRTVTTGTVIWRMPRPGEAAAAPGWTLADAKSANTLRSIIAIEKGLTAEDRVIVNGLQKARPGIKVAPENAELRPPAAAK